MTVNLTPHRQELLQAALARGVGRSAEEVIERALEVAAGTATLSESEQAERREAASLARQILPLSRTYELSAYDAA
jgi:hypothetical protein